MAQVNLLNLALILALQKVLSALVLGQKIQLAAIDSATPLSTNDLHGLFIFHAQLNERNGDQNGRAPEAGHAVHAHASFRVLTKFLLDQSQPFLDYLLTWRGAVSERELGDRHTGLSQVVGLVGRVGRAHEVGDLVLLEDLDVVVNRRVLRLLSDEEAHVFELDFGGRRAD